MEISPEVEYNSKNLSGLLFHSVTEIDKCGLIFHPDVIICHQNQLLNTPSCSSTF